MQLLELEPLKIAEHLTLRGGQGCSLVGYFGWNQRCDDWHEYNNAFRGRSGNSQYCGQIENIQVCQVEITHQSSFQVFSQQ